DANGKSVPGARVVIRPQVNANPEQLSQPAAVDEHGRFEFRAFPGVYTLTASAQGFLSAGAQFEVQPEGNVPEVRLTLQRAIVAKIRVVWIATPMQAGGDQQQ